MTLALLAALLAAPARAAAASDAVAPTRLQSTRLERVSAQVRLTGTAQGLQPGQPRTVIMSGVADFRDEDGGLSSGPTSVAVGAVLDGSPGCRSGWAKPAVPVLLQRDGRYVAGAVVEGTLSVSACVDDGAARLEGLGTLSGDALDRRP